MLSRISDSSYSSFENTPGFLIKYVYLNTGFVCEIQAPQFYLNMGLACETQAPPVCYFLNFRL